jgi:hypothetical protein
VATLTELSMKYNTDKNPDGHNYMPMYEFWLANRKVESFLEVGFGRGGSARMWREYFPEARIDVIELFGDEFHQKWFNQDIIPGVNITRGDASNKETWKDIPDNLDVIVEDAGHYPNEQIQTFMIGFQKLRVGGLYFIEDIYYNFEADYTDHDVIFPWLNSLMLNQQFPGNDALPTASRDHNTNRRFMDYPARDIYAYHIYKSVLVFEKG